MTLFAAGCSGLLWLSQPPILPARRTDIVPTSGGPQKTVEAIVDDRGIPHIFGSSEPDLAYGLGFFHARDRLFQILVLKHAAQGRLTELFGEEFLGTDQSLRLLTYRLDDQVAAMAPRDREILDAYLDGLNKGAGHAGASAEMRVLGVDWTPFTARDAISLLRLQSWSLSFDLEGELNKSRVLARLPAGDARQKDLLSGVPARGVAIWQPGGPPHQTDTSANVDAGPAVVETDGGPEGPPEAAGVADGGAALPPLEDISLSDVDAGLPPPLDVQISDGGPLTPSLGPVGDRTVPDGTVPDGTVPDRPTRHDVLARVRSMLKDVARSGRGASNSWAVAGRHTASGRAVLVTDPHLRHLAPSTFYLAHLEGPDFTVVGPTFPGLPAVVIGVTRHLAWAMTTSYVDTQDLVRIELARGSEQKYVVDGQVRTFGRWVHRFVEDDVVIRSTVWRTTLFGPVLPEVYGYKAEPGQTYAAMWTGFDPEANRESLSAFWDLAKAASLDEARAALEKVGAPSQNVVLALTDGTIAYHLMGKVPRRRSAAPLDRPRDGRTSDSAWAGYLTEAEKPAFEDPESGIIVAANQRVVDDEHPASALLGRRAALPHRAERLWELLTPMVAARSGELTTDDLLALQDDIVSLEARRLQPALAAACPETLDGYDDDQVKAFCDELRGFDGTYDTLSRGALPFTWLLEVLVTEILDVHLGTDIALQMKNDPVTLMAIEEAILAEERGETPALLDDRRTPAREGLAGFVERAVAQTLDHLDDEVGDEPADWRWGRVHVLKPRGPLARAPVVGSAFELPARAQSGWSRCVRAEAGIPVEAGAVFRMVVELSEKPEARMTLDLGQSGHFGHRHFADQRSDWNLLRPRPVRVERDKIPVESQLLFVPLAEPRAAAPPLPDADAGPRPRAD